MVNLMQHELGKETVEIKKTQFPISAASFSIRKTDISQSLNDRLRHFSHKLVSVPPDSLFHCSLLLKK